MAHCSSRGSFVDNPCMSGSGWLGLLEDFGFCSLTSAVVAVPSGTFSAAGLAFRVGCGTLDAEAERFALRTLLRLFFPLLSIVRFARTLLGVWLALGASRSAISFRICFSSSVSSFRGRGCAPRARLRFSAYSRCHARCFSAHLSQRVCPCIAAWPQRHRPCSLRSCCERAGFCLRFDGCDFGALTDFFLLVRVDLRFAVDFVRLQVRLGINAGIYPLLADPEDARLGPYPARAGISHAPAHTTCPGTILPRESGGLSGELWGLRWCRVLTPRRQGSPPPTAAPSLRQRPYPAQVGIDTLGHYTRAQSTWVPRTSGVAPRSRTAERNRPGSVHYGIRVPFVTTGQKIH